MNIVSLRCDPVPINSIPRACRINEACSVLSLSADEDGSINENLVFLDARVSEMGGMGSSEAFFDDSFFFVIFPVSISLSSSPSLPR